MAKKKQTDPKKLAVELAETGRAFHVRGWALGTSGNYSAVLKDKPLRLLITSSGVDKAQLNKRHFWRLTTARIFCVVMGGRRRNRCCMWP